MKEMTYDDVDALVDKAWYEFFNVLSENGIDAHEVEARLNIGDIFSPVFGAVLCQVDVVEEV